MPDWVDLQAEDRRELLLQAAGQIGRQPAVLEKDVWVVQTLSWIAGSRWAGDLVFKGGTSLSKAYRAIDRFSEDIDLTHDIRRLVPEVEGREPDPIPGSKSQEKKWTGTAKRALKDWIRGEFMPAIAEAAGHWGARVEVEESEGSLLIHYPPALAEAPDYLRTAVKLEFGGRATGEPADWMPIACDIAGVIPEEVRLPSARVRTMSASRTFWEKVTAMHVHCRQTRPTAERFARHWFDVACLHRKEICGDALTDRDLAARVVEFKRYFFRPSAKYGDVDLGECIDGRLRVLPEGDHADGLRGDYEAMRNAGYLGEAWHPDWDEVLAVVAEVQERVNQAFRHSS